MRKTKIYAHRGDSDTAPENTMAAFQCAKQNGANGIELDVMMSNDNQLIIIHDDTIDRTSDGSGNAGQMDYAELLKYDFGSWMGEEYKDERIPLFKDVAKFIKDSNMLVNIEIKPSLKSQLIENEVINLCKKYDIVEQSVVSSFNHFAIKRVKNAFPELETAVLYSCGIVDAGKYAKEFVGADGIHPHYLAILPEVIQSAVENNIKLRTWTVDDVNMFAKFTGLGIVDAVITNCPGRLRQAMNELMK